MAEEFIKGDRENLEGRVIVFSRFTNPLNLKETKYLAAFGTYDRDLLLDKAFDFRITPEDVAHAVEEGDERSPPWYIFTIHNFTSETDIFKEEPDIINIGPTYDSFKGMHNLARCMAHYGEKTYRLQNKGKLKQLQRSSKTYESFKGQFENTVNYINFSFINPMIYAKLSGETQKIDYFQQRFFDFLGGSEFLEDAKEICARVRMLHTGIENVKVDKNLKLIDLLATKISLLNGERFEDVLPIIKEISLLH